jgi:GT2 family glycosyltransferase
VPDLAVLIVSYNVRNDLENCVRSLLTHPPRTSHEVVVIDNASTDGSVEAIRTQFPSVRVVRLERNTGFAHANNEGIRQTRGELILLLNSDTVVPEGAIDRLVDQFRKLPGAAIVGPRLVDGQGVPELSFGRMISPANELRQKLITRWASPARRAAITSHTREVDWVSGACLLVSRQHAEAAGLLDERYFMYCEDVDFCAAVRSNGGRVYFAPAAEIVHLRGRSWRGTPTATTAAFRRSQLAFYEKHLPIWAPFLRMYLRLKKAPSKSSV